MTEDKTDFNKVTDFDNLYNAYKKSKVNVKSYA